MAECMVKTVNKLLINSKDPFLAVLSYRATPLPWCSLSPAELCMGRKIRTTVPQPIDSLKPNWSYLSQFRRQNKQYKMQQKSNFDTRHQARETPDIPNDTEVWINSGSGPVKGTVAAQTEHPRSYIINTDSGVLRRNQSKINMRPQDARVETDPVTEDSSDSPTAARPIQNTSPSPIQPKVIMTQSRTGNSAGKPDYHKY